MPKQTEPILPKTLARHTIEVESYIDFDGLHKISIASGGTVHHYVYEEYRDLGIEEAFKNLLDPIDPDEA